MTGLRALVVDDERPALDELAYLLGQDPRIGEVITCDSATEVLRTLQDVDVDVVFLDIQMPGLTGLELAQVLARFRVPPAVVFVTAHEQHAVEAFDLRAIDYVLKPVRAERLAEAVRRLVEDGDATPAGGTRVDVGAPSTTHPAATPSTPIPVERGGVTRFVQRSEVSHVEAQGDYARLHTADGSHLIRSSLATLEDEWRAEGFVRIHRSLLVSLRHIEEVRMDSGRCTVLVGGQHLVVSRRHTRELREVLLKRADQR